MESVSRHLGDYRIRFNNSFDYSLFVSIYLYKNVLSDFRYGKIIPYTRDEETITGMKIISMDTNALKKIIENKVKYKYLYEVFDKYHEMPLETVDWHDGMIKEVAGEYKALFIGLGDEINVLFTIKISRRKGKVNAINRIVD